MEPEDRDLMKEGIENKKIYPLKCNACGKRFQNTCTLERHKASHIPCEGVGTWYVCRRCLHPFEKLSTIKRHHNNKTPCTYKLPDLPRERLPPPTVVNKLRVMKGVEDNGGEMERYFEKVIERDNQLELFSMLDAISLEEVDTFLSSLKEKTSDKCEFIQYLSSLAEFSNRDDTSPEKAVKIKEYVLTNTTL